MVLFFSIAFTFFNVLLWIVMLVRFKKLFSTDDIIARTRGEMNNLVRDINNNTTRNIDLLENRTQKLRSLIDEADKKIQYIEEELSRQNTSFALRQQVKNVSKNIPRVKNFEQRALESYKSASSVSVGERTYELTPDGEAYQAEKPRQGNLFGTQLQPEIQDTVAAVAETKFAVSENGSSVAQVPVLLPKIYFAEEPLTPSKKSFDATVLDLYDQGFSVENISKQLSCSTTEVQFIVDLNR